MTAQDRQPVHRQRRILFVHAHPDDESITTGATMAKYAAEGAHVCLVTCTLGEEGEVIPDDLRFLASDKEDRLGDHRVGELAEACAALGVHDHRFLGGPGRWRDSGMMGTGTNDDPRCFWRADVEEAAGALARVIREVAPQVVVSYDERGNYEHPDHIQAHRVLRRAVELAGSPADGVPPWQVAKVYATATPRTVLARSIAVLRDADHPFRPASGLDEIGFGVRDDQVTSVVDARAHLPEKLAALRAHRTQIMVAAEEPVPIFALSNDIAQQVFGVEYYTLLAGEPGPAPAGGREPDLFAGLV